MHRTAAAALACAVLLVAMPVGAASGGFAALAPGSVSPDRVDLSVDVAANGSATWTVTYRMALTTENETAAFADLQRDVRRNTSSYLDPFRRSIEATVRTAENATGREMNATNFSVTTRVQSIGTQYGVVAYHFTWHGFAAVDGRTVHAGDAIAGFYLDGNTTLTMSAPEDYTVSSVSPPPAERTTDMVRWDGPLTFTTENPSVTFTPAGSPFPWTLVAGVAALLVLAGGGAVWYRRRTTGDTGMGSEAGAPGGGTGDGASAGEPTSAGGGAAKAEPAGDAAAATSAEDTVSADEGADEASGAKDTGREEPPPELLSNEERVKRVLREHGGRARQQEVVAETGWTEAKTSQVVSGMREAGELESFRIGRENVLKLPDDEEGGEP
ncbi:DUF7345 domain-containing protein [Halarchaeum sp. P4]|uniref:DUF7345 domain-containing protein n=1 Tax=Halarchaeum sp. P4 TaxID=3421639 RepID=UPI003EC0F3D4